MSNSVLNVTEDMWSVKVLCPLNILLPHSWYGTVYKVFLFPYYSCIGVCVWQREHWVLLLMCWFVFQFQRDVGEKEEHADLWIGYCAFHLGDYKRAMEVGVCSVNFILVWREAIFTMLYMTTVHYCSKVWVHLKMSLFLKEKHFFVHWNNIKLIRNTV